MRIPAMLAFVLPLTLAACATPPVVLENGSSPKIDLNLCYKWGDVRKSGPDNTQSYFLGKDGSPVFASMTNVTEQSVPPFCDILADFNSGKVLSPRTQKPLLTTKGGAGSMTFDAVASSLYRAFAPETDLYRSIVAERRGEGTAPSASSPSPEIVPEAAAAPESSPAPKPDAGASLPEPPRAEPRELTAAETASIDAELLP